LTPSTGPLAGAAFVARERARLADERARLDDARLDDARRGVALALAPFADAELRFVLPDDRPDEPRFAPVPPEPERLRAGAMLSHLPGSK
jgi:hypothetical protein